MRYTNNSQGVAMPIIMVVIALIAVIGSVFWFSQEPQRTPSNDNNTMMKDEATNMEKNTNDAIVKDADKGKMMEDEQKAATNTTTGDMMMKKDADAVMENDTDSAMMKKVASGYVTFSSQAYADAKDQKRVLFFHATWCPTCKAANADFTANASKIPSNVVVLKTDYDTETALKSKYGITYQHTFVQVDADDNAITKWNGGDVDELLKNLK